MRIQQMNTSRGGKAKDQFVHHDNGKSTFQSYGTTIAIKYDDGRVELDSYYWDYSATTGKYRNQFLNEGIADTRKRIASGEYKLVELN